jgi:hypothetical protein
MKILVVEDERRMAQTLRRGTLCIGENYYWSVSRGGSLSCTGHNLVPGCPIRLD